MEPWYDKIAAWKAEDPLTYDKNSNYILAQHAIDELSNLTRAKTRSSRSASASIKCGRPSSTSYGPRTWMSSSGLGTMGFGLPAAMGAKVAHPDKHVIDIDGDGCFLMNIQELATCAVLAKRFRSRCCCSTTSTSAW